MPWRHIGEWMYGSTIGLGTKWMWVASFMPWLLYTKGNRPQDPLDRRLGGPQTWFGHCGIEISFSPAGNDIQVNWKILFSLYSGKIKGYLNELISKAYH
jgi:hypothetical protein